MSIHEKIILIENFILSAGAWLIEPQDMFNNRSLRLPSDGSVQTNCSPYGKAVVYGEG